MSTNSPNAYQTWRPYATVLVIILLVGAIVVALAATGTINRWLGHEDAKATTTTATQATQLWTCGMHPQVIQDHPGDCPICHMELTPLKAPGAGGTTAILIDPVIVQNMGVRTAEVTRGRLRNVVRTVGVLAEAEPNAYDVNLRVSGWVQKLHANTVGMHLNAGDPLFDLYSPQLQTAIEELIAMRPTAKTEGDELTTKRSAAMFESAERKLLRLGLTKQQVALFGKLDHAPQTVTFVSPVNGHVTEKSIVEGSSVNEGDKAMRIVDHTTLWLDAQVYESQFPFVKIGQKATATVAAIPGKTFSGEVMFVHPHVDPASRTVLVRLVVPNESMELRPGMYARVEITADAADEVVLAPREAVIDTGTRQIAFLAGPAGHFEPRDVKLGSTGSDGLVQVLDGLKPGETVVTSGQFLIDAESRMKEAIQKHLTQKQAPAVVAANTQTKPAATTTTTTAAATVDTDALVKAYLALSGFFGKPQASDDPADVRPLVTAAEALDGPLAARVARAASAMKGHPVDHQRAMFKPLSEAVIALVEQSPPSKAVAGKLFVLHCPMADEDRGADWLQTTDKIANPFFATAMKRCGEVKRGIELHEKR